MRGLTRLIPAAIIGITLSSLASMTSAARDDGSRDVASKVATATSNAGNTIGQFGPTTPIHYAANANLDAHGRYVPGMAGFNLADISNVSQLNLLPRDVHGLVWIGLCNGVDAGFLRAVRPFIGNQKLFGFYLMDDPDPTGKYAARCTADNLKAESDWIHANIPGAQTFILLMNNSTSMTPSFTQTYNPTNSHIDLFGIDPYPCRSELNGCDFKMIDRYVVAAESWGIPRSRMIPVYQTFGGGKWIDDRGGKYSLPTPSQEQGILARWAGLVPRPVFDYAYSWGSQRDDIALGGAADLQKLFLLHNTAAEPRK